MLEWLWWLGSGVLWMAAGACVLALVLCLMHMGEDQEARVWRKDEEARRWRR